MSIKPFHLTATRERFGVNPKGYGWASASDRIRSTARVLPVGREVVE